MSSSELSLAGGAGNKPPFLAGKDYDLGEMSQYSQPPRLKIIQALTSAPFKPPFMDADAIVIPQMMKVGDRTTEFSFTPIYFFPSFICWNPAQLKNQLVAVREQSLDPNSTTAQKARAFVKEKCPENQEFYLKYAQMLNFLCIIHDKPEIAELPVLFFFNRGEFKTGQTLIGLIQARQAPPHACRFRAIVASHKGKIGDWYGLDLRNDTNPWVAEEEFNRYQVHHDRSKEIVQSRKIILDLNDNDVPGEGDAANDTKY